MAYFKPRLVANREGNCLLREFLFSRRRQPLLTRMGCARSAAALALMCAVATFAELPPSVPPPRALVFPTPAIRVLPNGVKVVAVERHSLPLVTVRLVIRAGAQSDPPGLPGEAQFAAALLTEGTLHRSALQIADAIDDAGGTVDSGADWDESYLTLSVLSDHAGLAFNLVSDMAIQPAFAPPEVERQRKQAISALKVSRDDPAYLADTVFNELVFAGTPYGHPPDGTLESMQRITAEELRSFHQRHYRPSRAILAVDGDISTGEAFALAEKWFGSWQEVNTPQTPSSQPARVPAPILRMRQIVVIDKPDAVQTEIRIGNPGVSRESPDFDALTVANQILGGPATNRLFKALRTQQGLTYGASSDLVCHLAGGSWVARTSTRTSETIKSIHVILNEMKNLREDPISGPELETAQSYLTGHLALKFETADSLAAGVVELMVHGLPVDYWNRFPENIRSLGTDGILNATRQVLDPEKNVIVLVGNAEAFSKQLKKLGRVRIISFGSLDLDSPKLVGASGAGPGSSERTSTGLNGALGSAPPLSPVSAFAP